MANHKPSSPELTSAAILDNAVVLDGRTYAMHSQHWYDDGNFGFLVESAAFLLHRSFLARRSPVMADMFGLPQRSPSQSPEAPNRPLDTINGIPFVVLHDKAEDFINILDIIYADITMAGEQSDLGATALMGIIRFANKYLFDKVKEWGVSQTISSRSLLVVEHESLRPSLQDGSYSDPEFCVGVIQFARECNLPQFLPLAFYALASTDWSQKSSEDFHSLSKLSPMDLWRIQEGKLKLTKALLEKAYKMPENGCMGERCEKDSCRRSLPAVWIDPTLRWMQLQLHPLEELEFRLTQEYGLLCDVCKEDLLNRTKTLRDDLVCRLVPEFFHID
ncbi:hypothetical protein FRC00_006577 [Tulasnella sp. 408]|nr:hypothetical protein FRC00_006577 [Tulasnella sp. 408]